MEAARENAGNEISPYEILRTKLAELCFRFFKFDVSWAWCGELSSDWSITFGTTLKYMHAYGKEA